MARHGSWTYQFRLTGGKQQRRGGFGSQSQAHAALQQARAELLSPPEATEPAMTTKAWLLFWLAEKEHTSGASAAGRKVAATTARAYRAHLELYLIPALGPIPLPELRPRDISQMFRDLQAAQADRRRPLSAASLRRVYATLRSALNAAVRQQKIERNPALLIDLASGARPKAMVWTVTGRARAKRTARRRIGPRRPPLPDGGRGRGVHRRGDTSCRPEHLSVPSASTTEPPTMNNALSTSRASSRRPSPSTA
jgi:hypothetical protein